MSRQQQDLVFFDDNSLISEKSFAPHNHVLHVITHSDSTQPAWLVHSLIETCLVGTASLVNRDLSPTLTPKALVTYVSFLHTEEFLIKNCRKLGLDLGTASDFHFVDCFQDLFSKIITHPSEAKNEVGDMFSQITKKLQADPNGNKVVIVHSPEILLAATHILSNDLIHHLQNINRSCNTLFVVSNTDSSLIDLSSSNPSDPVFRITDFYVKLHHKSSLNVNLLPLATGKAKDITGSLIISKGALPYDDSVSVLEKEYVFHMSKEANVKIFFR
ncbi:hypothetical protein METBIDRAFT_78212 [Metschnikowia bicuspidata var. bicuspidata NRRL YB-4993]|uniref:Elongator complex protein 6 n=1 Tax=Metschnikowia bicuspidata var. bicuspidata NRRL YB-4993 TaxID=869754 RepID=A0A1A0HAK7_9ASCO|nr:hypothetical protein METBIDRAFT_78212 [Metschnikowia bicuspidata var. bicuspidata NRRL YB-4993]OBA21164.1 hypothetical protein METBIDRAFT_78212 [Metschnikowia bicuspidata var. bicuspidata NRRL YB-4993]